MSKVILEFDMYEDQEAYKHALNAGKYIAALQELDNYLRGRLKYEELPENVANALQEVRDKLHDNGFSIWE